LSVAGVLIDNTRERVEAGSNAAAEPAHSRDRWRFHGLLIALKFVRDRFKIHRARKDANMKQDNLLIGVSSVSDTLLTVGIGSVGGVLSA
jgi:hypothetical protein